MNPTKRDITKARQARYRRRMDLRVTAPEAYDLVLARLRESL